MEIESTEITTTVADPAVIAEIARDMGEVFREKQAARAELEAVKTELDDLLKSQHAGLLARIEAATLRVSDANAAEIMKRDEHSDAILKYLDDTGVSTKTLHPGIAWQDTEDIVLDDVTPAGLLDVGLGLFLKLDTRPLTTVIRAMSDDYREKVPGLQVVKGRKVTFSEPKLSKGGV